MDDDVMDEIDLSQFSTLDLYLASYLIMKGHSGRYHLDPRRKKIAVLFRRSSELMAAIDDFKNGSPLVNVREYVDLIKNIRSRIHRRRDDGLKPEED